jgi:hypothetical protein
MTVLEKILFATIATSMSQLLWLALSLASSRGAF